jgi:hypothetical protein
MESKHLLRRHSLMERFNITTVSVSPKSYLENKVRIAKTILEKKKKK